MNNVCSVCMYNLVAFGVVPFLKDIMGRMLPMMGIAKQENMRWVFANCELNIYKIFLYL